MRHISAILTAIVLFITASCDNGADCNINNVAYNRIQLYSAIADGDTIVSGKYSYPDTLTVKLVINGNDSIVINHIFTVYIPVIR